MLVKFNRIYQLLKKSLSSESYDYTSGAITDAVVLLAIPMILELSLESVFAVVDMFFVGKLGPQAIAVVGLTESIATIVYSLAIGLSMGATAIIARRVGEKNLSAASKVASQSLLIAFVLSIFVSYLGIFHAQEVLQFMGADSKVASDGAIFTQILIGGNLVIFLIFLINGIFRGAGYASMAMKSLWIASGTNIILCPILIYFFGLKGAALATVFGRGTGVFYQLYHLFKKTSFLQIKFADLKPDHAILKNISIISWSASLQFIIGSGSWIFLTKLVAEVGGTLATAGYQIAFRCFVFFILPAWGLGNAAATLVGQNLGAKKIDRAELSVRLTIKYSVYIMSVVTLVLILFTDPIIGIFTNDITVALYGIEALRILGSGFILYGIAMILTQSLNGAGDTKTPTKLNFLCFWLFQTPLAYFLCLHTSLKTFGAVVVVPIAHLLLIIIAWIYFKRGNWKNTVV